MSNSPPTFQVSQGSAAIDLRGENFNKLLFQNSFLNIVVKKLRKSVSICQSYRKNKSGTFLWTMVYKYASSNTQINFSSQLQVVMTFQYNSQIHKHNKTQYQSNIIALIV